MAKDLWPASIRQQSPRDGALCTSLERTRRERASFLSFVDEPLKRSLRRHIRMKDEEYLRLKVAPDSDGTGKLTAEVAASGFAGRGEAWFDLERLARFSQELRAFPLSKTDPPHIQGGFWSRENRGALEQVHLSIKAYQIGSRGEVGIRVEVADPPLWPNDRPDSQNTARIELMTTYAALERFARDLDTLLKTNRGEAVLITDRFT